MPSFAISVVTQVVFILTHRRSKCVPEDVTTKRIGSAMRDARAVVEQIEYRVSAERLPTLDRVRLRYDRVTRRGENHVTEFIIHIGPHKTGTTYLQTTLYRLRGALSERGIHVPSIWDAAPDLPSHMKLVWAMRNGELALIHAQVQAILAQQPRLVVVSCEALSRLNVEQIARFRQLLGPGPARIVYYVRRWPERLPSLWQETVKWGHDTTFPEFFTAQLMAEKDSAFWDAIILDRYAAVFGDDQIKIVSYSHLTDCRIDIASHFLAEFLKETQLFLPEASRPNASLPATQTETIRALNFIHRRSGGEQSPALRSWFLRNREGLVPDVLLNAMHDNMDTIRLDEALLPLMHPFDDLLARYRRAVVPPYHVNGLHELRVAEARFIRQNYLLTVPAVEALTRMYDEYRRAD